MFVIPVIDIRHGVVVRAVAGDRANYQPISSPLFDGCDPRAAIRGLMALHPFPVIYAADLDGIEGRGRNLELVRAMAAQAPGATIWLDNGSGFMGVCDMLADKRFWAVVGTESITLVAYLRLLERFAKRTILSLDFRQDAYLGSKQLLLNAELWPDHVVVMTLGRVGTSQGPDLDRIAGIFKRARKGTKVFAAGGVRNGDDLRALAAMGVAGALVSTALHAQTITADDL
ncbi:MAG: HisA/HisF-related TIM barrel protein [Hyphomicrobiaceae bacterium]